jgi:hypothetical protein
MPIYLFKDVETGETEDLFFNSDHAPSIGEEIRHGDKTLRRMPSFVLDTAGIARKTHKYPYVSRSLPRNIRGCEVNKKGQPIIKSQAHERNVASEHDMAKE